MINISLLEKSIPVAPIKIAALESCAQLASQVDAHLVQFRKELNSHNQSGLNFRGYAEDSFLIDCECPRFGSGEAKGVISESIRGTDMFVMVDVCNHSMTYKICGHTNHMSPDDHYQDLKRIIATAAGKAHRINVIMPFLYESRQHNLWTVLLPFRNWCRWVFPISSLLTPMIPECRMPFLCPVLTISCLPTSF